MVLLEYALVKLEDIVALILEIEQPLVRELDAVDLLLHLLSVLAGWS